MGERRTRESVGEYGENSSHRETTADDDMLRDALLENLHRVALNPLEEAAAYQQMLKEFGLTQEKLAQSISKSRPQITNTFALTAVTCCCSEEGSSRSALCWSCASIAVFEISRRYG